MVKRYTYIHKNLTGGTIRTEFAYLSIYLKGVGSITETTLGVLLAYVLESFGALSKEGFGTFAKFPVL